MKITLKAIRDYNEEPVKVKFDEAIEDDFDCLELADGRKFLAQPCEDYGCAIIIATLAKDEEVEGELTMDGSFTNLKISDAEENRMEIYIGGKLFTEYVFDPAFKKPFLGPVLASDGETSFTRLDLVTTEHPHQRSIISAVGDVNGIDFWNEFGNFGIQKHNCIEEVVFGSAFASLVGSNTWQTVDGEPVIDEKRTFTFYNQQGNAKYIDIKIDFTAAYCDITFGKTKEAGPLGIRMNESLRADRGGSFTNSYGGINEGECWGKPAHFCDYKGTINGKLYGIAVFDNESNERYPTTWHIRNYGLFAANNLYFKGGYSFKKGETVTYNFRICVYEGNQINTYDRFNCYVAFNK